MELVALYSALVGRGKCMGNDGVEDLRHHTMATSQNGWAEVGSYGRYHAGLGDCARYRETGCDMRHRAADRHS